MHVVEIVAKRAESHTSLAGWMADGLEMLAVAIASVNEEPPATMQ
jgi:hypothetical protein